MAARDTEGTEGATRVRLAVLVLAIAIVHVLAVWYLRTPGLGWGEDDAQYALLGRALQHLQYREIWDIQAPVHARYPPGLPAMLAVVGAVSGNSLDAILGFMAALSGVTILLLFDATRRAFGAGIALPVAVLYSLNPSVLRFGGNLLSETPFTFFVVLALWALSRERDGTRYSVLAGMATVLGALTRTAGLAFVVALAVYWLTQRHYRRTLFLVVGAVPIIAWIAFSVLAPDPTAHRLYVADFLSSDEGQETSTLVRRLRPIPLRIWRYATRHIPTALSVPTIQDTPVDNVLWLALGMPILLIGMTELYRRWRAGIVFVATYGALLAVWVFAFERLLVPVLPVLVVALLVGSERAAAMAMPRARTAVVLVICGLMLVGAGRRGAELWVQATRCDRHAPERSDACWTSPEREYLQLAQWVRDSTPSNAAVFAPKEGAFYFHANRRVVNQIRTLSVPPDTLVGYLSSMGVRYAVAAGVGPRGWQQVRLLAEACRGFRVVRGFGPGTVLLERVDRETQPAGGDACETLASLRGDR